MIGRFAAMHCSKDRQDRAPASRLLQCVSQEVAHRYRRQHIEFMVAIGGTADMDGLAALLASDANDPSRKQRVHCNNRRTCPVFSRKSVEKFLSRNLQAELHPVWVIPSLIDARQEIDMPPVAFPA
jgi:hypothetical protein